MEGWIEPLDFGGGEGGYSWVRSGGGVVGCGVERGGDGGAVGDGEFLLRVGLG